MLQPIAGAMMVLCIAALFPARASAQVSSADEWHFGATLYGYFPSLGGSTKFPSNGSDIVHNGPDKNDQILAVNLFVNF